MLNGASYPQYLPLVRQWLTDRVGVTVWTRTPSNLVDVMPTIQLGLSPSGTIKDFERSVGLDVNLFAVSWAGMTPLISKVDTAMADLVGQGNDYGVIDDVGGGAFADVTYDDPNILRCVATYTLAFRAR